jgi:hypothetical protein
MYTVYLLSSEINGSKIYKIGFTKRNVENRIKEFQTGNASEIKIVETFKSKWGTKIESFLHRKFSNKKISGEWFGLNESDINNFIKSCQVIHNNYDTMSEINTYFIDRNGKN